MKDIFNLKRGQSSYFDNPHKFYWIDGRGFSLRICEMETYGVWHTTRLARVSGGTKKVRKNVFYLQRKDQKGTRTFGWFKKANEVASTLEEAKALAKASMIVSMQDRIDGARQTIARSEALLKDTSNFDVVDIDVSEIKNGYSGAIVKFKFQERSAVDN
jgi:hypothetical protein|tara:strand:+ start:428 stop:904 length:477 start_codon:yes stop_codon:yes gene_type:complete